MKSQPITQEIKNAIWAWYQEGKLTQTQMAELLNLSDVSVNQWLNGAAKSIRPKNWLRLYPFIEKFLPQDFKMTMNNSPIITGDHAIGVVHGSVNVCGPEIEDFRRRVQDSIMLSELDGDIKVKVYQLIGAVPRKAE